MERFMTASCYTGAMRAALYARVSTSAQDTENQLAQLREHCSQNKWKITVEYIDHGESGTKAERVQLTKMLEAAKQQRFDAVLVWALDRLSRGGIARTFENIDKLAQPGVKFLSWEEQ